MQVTTVLTGTMPLMMHNIQLANPDNHFAKRIAEFTKKRKKTEDDRRDIARLEWMGSLYIGEEGGIVMPTSNIRKCFSNAGKITKEGTAVNRAVSAVDIDVPFIHSGPTDVEKLIDLPEFRNQTLVTIGKQRVLRTRPIFAHWKVSADWEVMTEVLDLDDFIKIVKLAGRVEGLGDNRVGGYGRFTTEVIVAEEARRAA